VTQHNAAMFEETTAASQNLMAQADALSARMARFRVGDRPEAARRAAVAPPRTAPAPPAGPSPAGQSPAGPSPKPAALPISGSLALKASEDDWEDF
jgi:methyl-accepting chemotaxis protein